MKKFSSKFLIYVCTGLFLLLPSLIITPAAFSSDYPAPPPPPAPPYLQKPVDPNFDGTYSLNWSVVSCACRYQLQEADNPQFTNPKSYSTGAREKSFTKTEPGTFYYRVRTSSAAVSITRFDPGKLNWLCLLELLLDKVFLIAKAQASSSPDPVVMESIEADNSLVTCCDTAWSNVQSIAVAQPTSFIDGVIYQAGTETPIADAVITSPGFPGSVTSAADGKFSFGFQTFFPETGKLLVAINIEKTGNTSAQRVVEVTASQHATAGPIHLTTLDPVITTITPEGGTHVNSTNEIELVFPAGAVTEPVEVNSTKYQEGKALPNELPETSFFTYALNLNAQTSALYKGAKKKITTFQEPITMRVANTLGFAAGTPIPAGVYNEETKQWEDTGLMGQISSDGQWLEFQIDHFSPWDLNLSRLPLPQDRVANVTKNNTQDITSKDLGCAKDCGNSLVGLKAGVLYLDHELPAVKRLNSPFALRLSYNSLTAQPSSLISVETDLNTVTTNVPATTTFKASIAGRKVQATYQGVGGKVRYAYLFDGRDSQGNLLSSGSYEYNIETSNDYTNVNYWTTDRFGGAPIADTGVATIEPVPLTKKINGQLTINNQQNSSLGAGWNIGGLQRLYIEPDGSVLLTEGDGSAISYPYFYPGYGANGNNITCVDLYNKVISDEIPTGYGMGWPMVITPDGNYLYAVAPDYDYNPDRVVVVDLNARKLLTYITVGRFPRDIVITPNGKFVYVSNPTSGTISVIATNTNSVIETMSFPGFRYPNVRAVTPDGRYVYADIQNGITVMFYLFKIDTATNQVVGSVNLDANNTAQEILFSPDGNTAYANTSLGVYIVGVANDAILSTFPIANADNSISLSPDGRWLYIAKNNGYMDILDTISRTIVDTVNIDQSSTDLAISPDGKTLYLAYRDTGRVAVFDTELKQIVSFINIPAGIQGVQITPDGRYLYVGNSSIVSVIDTLVKKVIDTMDVSALTIFPKKVFIAPKGETSRLILDAKNYTYTRIMKDGSKINFNSQGLQTSVVDRNGNTTYYQYTDANADGLAEELSRIILPVGGYYQFAYDTSGKLQSITDPAARITQITVDANGDLAQIINPDNSTLNLAYDNHLLTHKTTERGFTTEYQYDNYSRVKKTITPTNPQEERQYFPSDVQGLINDLAPGVGTPTNPAPVVRPDDVVETVIDGKGYTTTSQTSKFGAYAKITDALTQTTTIDRDSNNNPVKITRPNNSTVSMTYDAKGNLLTSTEDSISATTTFTYEPNFNQVTLIKDARDNTTSIEYDIKGNPVQITDALNNITKMEYNTRGQVSKVTSGFGTALENNTLFTYYSNTLNLQTITDPLNNVTTFTYDDSGNILTSTDANSKTTSFEYDEMGRLTKVTDPDSKITQYQYDEAGNLKKIIDAKLHETNFTYDEINQLKTIVNPLNKTKTFTYDLNRNLSSVTDFKGQIIDFSYDEINRLTGKLANSQTLATFGYDAVNNLISALDADSSLTLGYDLAGRLTSATTANFGHQPATSMSFTFDKNSNRLTLTDPNSVITKYVYDALNRLTDITDASDVNIAHFGFDELSRRNALNFPNSTSTAYGYDLANRVQSIVHSPLSIAYSYTYDNVGNRETMVDSVGTHTYGYDNLYRLTSSTLPSETYAYDNVGNRNPASFVYDNANRLLDDGTYSYTYDDNGNCITKTNKSNPSDVTTYGYDIENRLIAMSHELSATSYTYDGLGRRIEKNVNGTITRYVYDNEDIIAEYDGSNVLQAKYLHGPGIDEPLRMERGGQNYFYHADGLGSITAITNSSGVAVNTYRYDAFGNIVSQTGTLANPFTYIGREFDVETGLYYYRARYYDSRVGRFLSEDPLYFASGDINLYPYTFNNPINFTDPTGEAVPLALVIIGAGGTVNGTFDAIEAIVSGESFGGIIRAFGHGFVSGAIGTTIGLAVGISTKNPFLVGSATGLSVNLTDQLISNRGQFECLNAASATESALLGGLLGPAGKKVPGLQTKGRLPNLNRPRGTNEFGKNSLRLIGQKAIGGVIGKSVGTIINYILQGGK